MKNGPLRFVSMADRALDVCQFEYRGENLVLRRTITSVYLHELAADENGRSFAAVVNRKLGLGVVIDFDASLFPYFMEWKSTGAGDYVVGLEPSNSSVHGRGWHEQRGDLHAIAPQASERKSLTFTVIEGEAAIDGLIARRDALLG